MKKVCALPECNEEFELTRSDKIYCSKKCRRKRQYDKGKASITKVCALPECNETLFNVHSNRKYCKICSKLAIKKYMVNYRNIPEVREKRRKYMEEYNYRPEVISSHKKHRREYWKRPQVKEWDAKRRSKPEFKAQRSAYAKLWNQKPEVKLRNRTKRRKRYATDPKFRLQELYKTRIKNGIKRYAKGKRNFSVSQNFGISKLKKITEELEKESRAIFGIGLIEAWEKFHIDHCIPETYYNHEELNELLKCWSSENLQLLTPQKNQIKGARIIKDHVEQVPKELWPKYFFEEGAVCRVSGELVKDILELE